jgi:hypothetical protein
MNSDFENRLHIVFECLTISRTTCACKIGSISSWMITVFRWIYFYTYLITELKIFAKLYQLTSFSPLRISVPGLCSSPSPSVTLDTVNRISPQTMLHNLNMLLKLDWYTWQNGGFILIWKRGATIIFEVFLLMETNLQKLLYEAANKE